MATISRGAKAAGGTSFSTGAILADEVNTDFDTVYNAINGNLDDDNVKAAADIDPSKIGDYSATASEMQTIASPGTVDSESLATTLEGELSRLRYAIGRGLLGVTGTNVERNDGAAKSVPWYERPARGSNLLRNNSFETQTAGSGNAPDGWAKVGTPTTVALVDTGVENGDGKALRIVADAAGEGISQSVSGLKASTPYLVTARVKVATGSARLTTGGADGSSEFRNVTVTTTSANWTDISAVVQTDSTPTALVVRFVSAASGDDFQVDHVQLRELNAAVTDRPGHVVIRDSSTHTGALSTSEGGFPAGDQLSCAVTVPGPGYTIRARACLRWTSGAADQQVVGILYENDGGGAVARDTGCGTAAASGESGSLALGYANTSPTSGATYTYLTSALSDGAVGTANGTQLTKALESWLEVELIPPG